MADDIIYINNNRNGYTVMQCGKTLTVGEMIEILKQYDEDSLVYIANDNGYTFSSITDDDISFYLE